VGKRIEAYGFRGMDRRQWRRTFKDTDSLLKWAEKNDAEIIGTREID